MSYEDMARSHVKELLRAAFRWESVVVDEDGDVPIVCGTAMVYASRRSSLTADHAWSEVDTGVEVRQVR